MKYLRIIGVLVLLSSILACKNAGGDPNSKKKNETVPVDVIIAANEDFASGLEVNGTVLSEEMIELHPEVSGRLVYLNIPDGAVVKAGTILAKINDAELQAQRKQQQVQLDLAVKTEQRLKKLLAVNGVNQAEYDASLNQVNLITANISIIDAQIEKTVIKAPFSGRLGLRLVSMGAYVTPATLIGTLQQTDKIKIDFTVPEAYEHLVKVGSAVSVKSVNTEETLSAIVTAIEPQINTNTRNMKVRARLENGVLNPGAFVKVMLDNKMKGVVVPTNAIIPDAMNNQLVVIKKGLPVFTNIETGIRTAKVVEITSGINVGDSVVVSGVLFVRPNSKVVVKSVKQIEKIINPDK